MTVSRFKQAFYLALLLFGLGIACGALGMAIGTALFR